MLRQDGRSPDKIRKVNVTKNYTKYAEGSCLIEFGDTRVICTATVEEGVPSFLKNTGTGWVTAEYGMLPRSCETRVPRDKSSGRRYEIQRLIGRALRGVVDMGKLGERTLKVDCDVIQADGGTRTASITGGFIALADAVKQLKKKAIVPSMVIKDFVAAISVGIVQDALLLDLNYEEDSKAEMDMNVVMLGSGDFVEIQGTAEGNPFSRKQMDALIELSQKGIEELIGIQKDVLGDLIV